MQKQDTVPSWSTSPTENVKYSFPVLPLAFGRRALAGLCTSVRRKSGVTKSVLERLNKRFR